MLPRFVAASGWAPDISRCFWLLHWAENKLHKAVQGTESEILQLYLWGSIDESGQT